MTHQSQNVDVTYDTLKGERIDILRTFRLLISKWWLYLIVILISFVVGWLYIRYSDPTFLIHAKILVKDSKKGNNFFSSEVFTDLDLFDDQNSVENEVELLKSRTLMEKTLEELQLNIRFYSEGKVKAIEMYNRKLPFVVEAVDLVEDSLKDAAFSVLAIHDNYLETDLHGSIKYYDTIALPYGKFLFKPNSFPASRNSMLNFPLRVKILKKDEEVARLQNLLSVAPTNKSVSTIELSISDQIPERGEEIINTLLKIYDQLNKDDKNRIADSTIDFINDRLKIVSDELDSVENKIQIFRQNNKLTDIESQGKLLLDNSSSYYKDLTQQEVQIELVKSLENYLNDKGNTLRIVPSTLSIEEPSLIAQVQAYNDSQLERERQKQTTAANNPVMQRLNVQIPALKDIILTNLANIRRGMVINRDLLKAKLEMFDKQMEHVPEKERIYLDFSRQQSVKQELYLFLLQKREETAISKSANVDNSRIVDSAKSETRFFKPKIGLVYAACLLFGVLMPTIVILVRNAFNLTVSEKADITSQTSLPIVAEISHSKESNIVVRQGERTPIAEQFRALRTNLQYLFINRQQKTILITSSMSGEGKSFIAVNLACAIALSGKKVVLMELDLRKPKITKMLNFATDVGFTNYVVGNVDLERIIVESSEIENLSVIPSGPIPPNPSELLMLPQVSTLFQSLTSMFDYVIIDSPPIGLVTDSQILASHADLTIFVVRQDYTFRSQISSLEEYNVNKKLPRINLVINDINSAKGYGYNYEYGYGNYFDKQRRRNLVKGWRG